MAEQQSTAVAKAVKLALQTGKFGSKMILPLSQKVTLANGKKEHKEVARVEIPFPTLADFGIEAEPALYEADDAKTGAVKGKPAYELGVPLYKDNALDWLQQAIVGKVAAISRNRYEDGKLKAGAVIAEDFETLCADVAKSGDALALRREALASFEGHLQKQNKKAATIATFSALFANSAKALGSAGDRWIEGLAAQVASWVPTLTPEQVLRFQPKLTELEESINAAQGADELDDDIMPTASAAGQPEQDSQPTEQQPEPKPAGRKGR